MAHGFSLEFQGTSDFDTIARAGVVHKPANLIPALLLGRHKGARRVTLFVQIQQIESQDLIADTFQLQID